VIIQNDIRALTLWRPWPHTILYGGKRLENRPWKPWKRVIGHLVAIHAGLKYDTVSAEAMRSLGYNPPEDKFCPKGCIVGVVRVTGYISLPPGPNDPQRKWYSGPYAWTLDDIVPFITPIKATGAQGLWTIKEGLKSQVQMAYNAAKEGEER
jgi:hypothetical protein